MTDNRGCFADFLPFDGAVQIGHNAFLTIGHSASSYGCPVLVIGDRAYREMDCLDDGYYSVDYATARELVISLDAPLKSMDPDGYYERFCR